MSHLCLGGFMLLLYLYHLRNKAVALAEMWIWCDPSPRIRQSERLIILKAEHVWIIRRDRKEGKKKGNTEPLVSYLKQTRISSIMCNKNPRLLICYVPSWLFSLSLPRWFGLLVGSAARFKKSCVALSVAHQFWCGLELTEHCCDLQLLKNINQKRSSVESSTSLNFSLCFGGRLQQIFTALFSAGGGLCFMTHQRLSKSMRPTHAWPSEISVHGLHWGVNRTHLKLRRSVRMVGFLICARPNNRSELKQKKTKQTKKKETRLLY